MWARSNAARCASTVVLPQPLSPTRPSVWPSSMEKLTPSTASTLATVWPRILADGEVFLQIGDFNQRGHADASWGSSGAVRMRSSGVGHCAGRKEGFYHGETGEGPRGSRSREVFKRFARSTSTTMRSGINRVRVQFGHALLAPRHWDASRGACSHDDAKRHQSCLRATPSRSPVSPW